MKEKVLLIMQSFLNIITNEDILNIEQFKDSSVEIKFIEEIRQNPQMINEYKCVLDFSKGQQIYNFILNQGIELKEGDINYVQINEQRFIRGLDIQHFIITQNELSYMPEELKIKKKETFNSIMEKIEFLKKFLIKKHNFQDVDLALKTGLVYEKDNKKYVITKKIPDIPQEGVEYITNADIPIIKDILEIMQYIKQ